MAPQILKRHFCWAFPCVERESRTPCGKAVEAVMNLIESI
jgi:hypothetical protein